MVAPRPDREVSGPTEPSDAVLAEAVACVYRVDPRRGEGVVPEGSPPRLPWSLLASADNSRHYAWRPGSGDLYAIRMQSSAHADPAECFGGSALLRELALEPPLQDGTEICQLILNSTASRLALVGPTTVAAVRLLPAVHASPGSLSDRETSTHRCASVHLDLDAGVTVVQASWHPLSNSHLAVLTSDNVFRLFNVEGGTTEATRVAAEQEYILQPGLPHGLRPCTAFAFGGHHLWERVTVLFLFADGSVFSLCPIVPQNSWVLEATLHELWREARGSTTASQAHSSGAQDDIALRWLNAAFPECEFEPEPAAGPTRNGAVGKSSSSSPVRGLVYGSLAANGGLGSGSPSPSTPLGTRATSVAALEDKRGVTVQGSGQRDPGSTRLVLCRSPTLWDASVALQGPASRLRLREGLAQSLEQQGAGPFSALTCTVVSQDSVLVAARASGTLELSVLAGEMRPLWNPAWTPSLAASSPGLGGTGSIVTLARPLSTAPSSTCSAAPEPSPERHPPLLTIGTADLGLAPGGQHGRGLRLIVDKARTDMIFCAHSLGVDSVCLGWLPFSNAKDLQQSSQGGAHKVEPVWEPFRVSRAPQVPPPAPLSQAQGSFSGHEQVVGAALSGSETGQGRLVGVSSSGECVVLPVLGLGRSHSGMPSSSQHQHTPRSPSVRQRLLKKPQQLKLNLSDPRLKAGPDSAEGKALLGEVWQQLHESDIKYAHLAYLEIVSLRALAQAEEAKLQAMESRVQQDVVQADVRWQRLRARLEDAQQAGAVQQARASRILRRVSGNKRPLSAEEKAMRNELDVLQLEEMPVLRAAAQEIPRKCGAAQLDGATAQAKHIASEVEERASQLAGDADAEGAVQQLSDAIADLMRDVSALEQRVNRTRA